MKTLVDRIDELAENGEISGQIAFYLKYGEWPINHNPMSEYTQKQYDDGNIDQHDIE